MKCHILGNDATQNGNYIQYRSKFVKLTDTVIPNENPPHQGFGVLLVTRTSFIRRNNPEIIMEDFGFDSYFLGMFYSETPIEERGVRW
jgi:hypothetical protein